MAVRLAITLLALVSLTTATDPTCQTLVIPLQDMSSTSGKWVFHVGTWDRESMKQNLESLVSSWLDLSPTSSSGERTIFYADRLTDGTCYLGSANSTVTASNTVSTFDVYGQITHHEGKYFETCPDCMLVQDTTLGPDGTTQDRYLFLFTRTGNLDAAQLETFKKQATCLNFLPQYHFTTTDLCPDSREPAAQ